MSEENEQLTTQEPEEETTPIEGSEESEEKGSEVEPEVEPEGEVAGPEATDDNSEKRINDLMSKWQSEEAARKKAEERLAELENNIKEEEPQKFADDFVPESYETLYEKFKERMTTEQAREQARAESVRQADRAKLNNWFESTEKKDASFNRETFLKFAGKLMERGIRVDTNNLDGTYEVYKDTQKPKIIEKKVDKVAPPSAKSEPSAGEVDSSILKSRKSPVELALEELRKRK